MGLSLLEFQANHLGAQEAYCLGVDCLETKSSDIRQRPGQHKPHCSILLRCCSLVCQLEGELRSHTFQAKSRHCSLDTICPTAPPVVIPVIPGLILLAALLWEGSYRRELALLGEVNLQRILPAPS